MNRTVILLLLVAVPIFVPVPLDADESQPPRSNILLIFTDDHGWADLGGQGVDPDVRTPNPNNPDSCGLIRRS